MEQSNEGSEDLKLYVCFLFPKGSLLVGLTCWRVDLSDYEAVYEEGRFRVLIVPEFQ